MSGDGDGAVLPGTISELEAIVHSMEHDNLTIKQIAELKQEAYELSNTFHDPHWRLSRALYEEYKDDWDSVWSEFKGGLDDAFDRARQRQNLKRANASVQPGNKRSQSSKKLKPTHKEHIDRSFKKLEIIDQIKKMVDANDLASGLSETGKPNGKYEKLFASWNKVGDSGQFEEGLQRSFTFQNNRMIVEKRSAIIKFIDEYIKLSEDNAIEADRIYGSYDSKMKRLAGVGALTTELQNRLEKAYQENKNKIYIKQNTSIRSPKNNPDRSKTLWEIITSYLR